MEVTSTSPKYTMRISRLTIDKLGIQMYDRVSAVLAELIANAYDADATEVTVVVPFDRYLARKSGDGLEELGYEITVEDDGSGMTSAEVNKYYLLVGFNRRAERGDLSPKWGRKVMGRKGIGKLAPFGICKEIEVLSSKEDVSEGSSEASHLFLRFDEILAEQGTADDVTTGEGHDEDYHPVPGPLDGDTSISSGTRIVLRQFTRRRVPSREELHRQLAARFGITGRNWKVILVSADDPDDRLEVGALGVDVMEGTRIDVDDRRVVVGEGTQDEIALPVQGWVAYAKEPYKDEVMAGVRILARGKLAAQTRDFEIRTGFTGEYKMRSYLTGEIHADWLDEAEDLISTDRQDIIWSSERGEAFRDWGRGLLKELAARSEVSVGQKVWDEFLQVSQLEDRLSRAAPKDTQFRSAVLSAARQLVARADREAVRNDSQFVERIVQLAFNIGPHRTLLEILEQLGSSPVDSLEAVLELFEKARIVEMYSLGQVASERVDSVDQLRHLVSTGTTSESQLQELVEKAPWILYAEWTPLSMNESLATTRRNFESWYQANYGNAVVTSAIDNPGKRPDFVLLNYEGQLELVEIKRPQYGLTDPEFDRAFGYLEAVTRFIAANSEVARLFRQARLTIVCDSLNLANPAYGRLVETDQRIQRKTWHDVLEGTTRAHRDFLKVVRTMQGALPAGDGAMGPGGTL